VNCGAIYGGAGEGAKTLMFWEIAHAGFAGQRGQRGLLRRGYRVNPLGVGSGRDHQRLIVCTGDLIGGFEGEVGEKHLHGGAKWTAVVDGVKDGNGKDQQRA
jgi:hypothetical protein